MQPVQPSAQPYYGALTGVRFVAAAWVVGFHVGAQTDWWLVEGVRSNGYVAVSFFFVLSGFLLAVRHPSATSLPLRRFYAARAARIFPLYLAALLLCLPAALWMELPPRLVRGDAFLLHAAALHAWFPSRVLSWNIPGWSLACEVFFYATFPLVLVFVQRWRAPLVFAALSWLASLAMVGLWVVLSSDDLSARAFIKFFPLARWPEFLVGVAVGVWFSRGRALPGRRAGAALFAAGGLVIVLVLGSLPRRDGPLHDALLHNGALAPAFAAVIVGLAGGHGAAPLFAGAIARRLGEASYGIYILQWPLLQLVALAGALGVGTSPAFVRVWDGARLLGGGTTFLVVLTGVALLTNRIFEVPARRLLRSVLGGDRARAEPITPRR